MSDDFADFNEDECEAIEEAITAASDVIAWQGALGAGRRWRAWGAKEMLIATAAASCAVQFLKEIRNRGLSKGAQRGE